MTVPTTSRSRWVGFGLALAWIAGLAALVFALHALGRGDLSTPPTRSLAQLHAWLDERDTPTAAVAVLRLGALAAACYLLAVTVLGLVARAVRSRGLMSLADAVTVPVARRLVGSVVGLSVSASTASLVAMPVLPHPHTRPSVSASNAQASRNDTSSTSPADGETTVVMRRIPRPHDDGTATMRVIKEPPKRPPSAPATPSPVTSWSVEPGDSFWAVGQRVLTEAWHRPPTDAELMPYWQALIAHNRGRLVDATNADLIYAGQVFELPTPPPQP